MAGRPRLPIGTFGDIAVLSLGGGRFRAVTRFLKATRFLIGLIEKQGVEINGAGRTV